MLASSKSFSLRARTTSAPRTARRASLVRASADVQTETATPEVAPKPGFKDVMAFGGWAPETINGRLAMLGFVAGVGCELGTGETLPVQFGEHFGIFAAHSLVFALASFMPDMQAAAEYSSDPRTIAPFGAFNAKAEMWNGRGAMIGLASMLVIESVTGSALIPFAPQVEPKAATYVPMSLDSYESSTSTFAAVPAEAPAPAVSAIETESVAPVVSESAFVEPTVAVDLDLLKEDVVEVSETPAVEAAAPVAVAEAE